MTNSEEARYLANSDSLSGRLLHLHQTIRQRYPDIDRAACALYDADSGLLKTFFNSTLEGEAIDQYQFRLSDSLALSQLAERADCRVIDNISQDVRPGTEHSNWLLAQGYQSSFTVPMKNGDRLNGFIFFDSMQSGVFTDAVQRDLLLYCNLINMAVVNELNAIACLMATARAAREFAGLRDFETGAHLLRMSHIARVIAQEVADDFGLNDEFIEHLFLFAPLHDIGKIGIPDSILLKPGKLDPDEWRIMQTHVEAGEKILHKVLDSYQLDNLIDSRMMVNLVACHHEYLDGSGYPRGLTAEEIPVEARITTVADILDALTTERPYKQSWSVADAIVELRSMADAGKLDRRCVAAVERRQQEITDVIANHRDQPEQYDFVKKI